MVSHRWVSRRCWALFLALFVILASRSAPRAVQADPGPGYLADVVSASVAYVFVDATANIYDPDAGSTYGTFESTWYGTGYFVNPDGWLVTNAHVAAPTQDDLMSAGANQPAAVAKRSHRLVEDGC